MSDHCCSVTGMENVGSINTTEVKCPRIRILPKEYRCGTEIPVYNTLYQTLNSLERQGTPCSQMYLTGRGNDGNIGACFSVCKFTEEDLKKSKQFCLDKDVNFYVHCPLIANLAKESSKRMQTVIQKELNLIKDLPASCVLHIGKFLKDTPQKGLANVAVRINELQFKTGQHERNRYPLLLECAAGQGTELGKNWEEIRKIYEAMDQTKIGLCLDTQHLFASGMSSFDGSESIVKLFDEVESVMGRKPSLIHVNDSKKEHGSNVDRHEEIGKGFIWYHNKDSLIELIKRCKEDSIDMILETHNPIGDLKVMNSLTDKL